MNCPGCGGPMRLEQDHLVCDYCGNIHVAEADDDGVRTLAEKADLDCPVCGVPLAHAVLGSIRLYQCDKCRGLMIPVGSFLAAIEDLRARSSGLLSPRPLEGLDRELQCPGCGRPMDTFPYGGGGNVVMDNCPRCELNWLDHGEPRRIARGPDARVPELPLEMPDDPEDVKSLYDFWPVERRQ